MSLSRILYFNSKKRIQSAIKNPKLLKSIGANFYKTISATVVLHCLQLWGSIGKKFRRNEKEKKNPSLQKPFTFYVSPKVLCDLKKILSDYPHFILGLCILVRIKMVL